MVLTLALKADWPGNNGGLHRMRLNCWESLHNGEEKKKVNRNGIVESDL